MISIQCHRVGEWWSGKPEFENVSDPAGVYIPFKPGMRIIYWQLLMGHIVWAISVMGHIDWLPPAGEAPNNHLRRSVIFAGHFARNTLM